MTPPDLILACIESGELTTDIDATFIESLLAALGGVVAETEEIEANIMRTSGPAPAELPAALLWQLRTGLGHTRHCRDLLRALIRARAKRL